MLDIKTKAANLSDKMVEIQWLLAK